MAGKQNFRNKIVVDVTNPLDHSKGALPGLLSTPAASAGEKIQELLAGAKVVKAFNTINAYIMINAPRQEGVPDLLIAGNDEGKKFVSDIALKWGWNSVIDLGDISQSYLLEAMAMVWIIYGFKNNSWSHAFKLLRK
jgi:predicted dinucleotide-binding enzyme